MLSYETIFSRTRSRIYDPKELSLNENDLMELYTERLHSTIGDTRVRRLFSTITMDDEIQEIEFTLNNSVDENADSEFVASVLAIGMVIQWLQPQVDSMLHTSTMIGGKEEKKILDNHSSMINRLQSLKKEQYKMIRDYGYMYNSYVNEET